MNEGIFIAPAKNVPDSRKVVQPELTIDPEGPGALLLLDATNISDVTYDGILKFDAVRHGIAPYRGAPHGYYVVGDPSGSERMLFRFFQGDDIFKALEEARRELHGVRSSNTGAPSHTGDSAQDAGRVLDAVSSLSISGRREVPYAERIRGYSPSPAGTRIGKSAHSSMMPMPGSSDRPMPSPPGVAVIGQFERNNSLTILNYDSCGQLTGFLYSLAAIKNDIVSKLILDTAETTTWFLGHGFRRILTDSMDVHDWPTRVVDGHSHPSRFRHGVARGLEEDRVESLTRTYIGGSIANLDRWGPPYKLSYSIPVWNWDKGGLDYSVVGFPMIVANSVNDVFVSMGFDGILGLSLPVGTSPWNPDKINGPGHLINFWNSLERVPPKTGESVEDAFQVIIRLLYPLDKTEPRDGVDLYERKEPSVTRDGIYFGRYWPWSAPTSDGPSPPSFTRGHIRAHHNIAGVSGWTVALLSITLLLPKKTSPNRNSLDENDWEKMVITMPTLDSTLTKRGTLVVLDTGAAVTRLPKAVVDAMNGQWIPRFLSNGGAVRSGSSTENAVPDIHSADLIFEFMGVNDQPVQHRCTAKQFLSSPWYMRQPPSVEGKDTAERSDSDMRLLNNLIHPMPDSDVNISTNTLSNVGILGLNFFWTAFVRLNFTAWSGRPYPPRDDLVPFIDLSPQRIVDTHGNAWNGQWFRINENGMSGYHMVHHENKPNFSM